MTQVKSFREAIWKIGKTTFAVAALALALQAALLAVVPARYESSVLVYSPEPIDIKAWLQKFPSAQRAAFDGKFWVHRNADDTALIQFVASTPHLASQGAEDLSRALVVSSQKVSGEGMGKSVLPDLESRIAELERALAQDSSALPLQPTLSFERQKVGEEVQINAEKLSKLSRDYGPKHPKMVQAEKALAESRARFEALAEPAAGQMREEAGETTLQLREELAFLKTIAQRVKQKDLSQQDVDGTKILKPAQVSLRPFWPDRAGTFWLTAFLSFPVGAIAGLFLIFSGRGFRSESELEEKTGFPCAGTLRIAAPPGKDPVEIVLREPSSPFVNALRALRTVLDILGTRKNAAGEEQKPKVLLVTSALRAEASPLLALWLGQLALRAGQKCLVIDADLRSPILAQFLSGHGDGEKLAASRTLADYLAGQAGLEDVLLRRDRRFPHLILGGAVPNTAGERLSSKRMETLLHSFRQVYDLIILNVPAAAETADALVLSKFSDQILFAVQKNVTDRAAVLEACRNFTTARQERICFVMDPGAF
jgi:succinoglycan biosynthesis transport protein ExoP